MLTNHLCVCVEKFNHRWRVRLKGVEFASFIFRENTYQLWTKCRVPKMTGAMVRVTRLLSNLWCSQPKRTRVSSF